METIGARVRSLLIFTLLCGLPGQAAEQNSATVPITIDHGRITVDVGIATPDGPPRVARAWVDTGGTNVTMTESLATDLRIELSGSAEETTVETTDPVPEIRIRHMALDVKGMQVAIHRGEGPVMPGIDAELVLPARCLRKLHVVFDYPERRLTVAVPGALKPQGMAVPIHVNPETGLFMVDVTIEGEVIPFGVDTGSAGTWVSEAKTAQWAKRHPDWPVTIGAAGSTNFFGFPFETEGRLMSLPALKIGSVSLDRETAVLGLSERLFEWYSKKSAAFVAGFLGGDVIERFRLEVDFPKRMSWWSQGKETSPRDLDIAGLTLRPEFDGTYTVAGVVSRNGKPVVDGVKAGDRLLRVDSRETTDATMGEVVGSLRGKPGSQRLLDLERSGKQFTVKAPVVHLP